MSETDDEHGFACKYCYAEVYWGDHYDSHGEPHRRLFNFGNKRLHDCGSKLDPDSFAAVVE